MSDQIDQVDETTMVDALTEIERLECDPATQDGLLREALERQPDVPATVRILASLERRPFHGTHPGGTT